MGAFAKVQVRTFELHSYLPGLAEDEMRRLLRNKNVIVNRQPVFWQLLKNSESNEAVENGLVTPREWPHPCMVLSMSTLTWLIFTWTTIWNDEKWCPDAFVTHFCDRQWHEIKMNKYASIYHIFFIIHTYGNYPLIPDHTTTATDNECWTDISEMVFVIKIYNNNV